MIRECIPEDVFTITLEEGIGPAGASAYQQAVSGGYEGTEEEYKRLLASYATVAEQAETSRLTSEAYAVGKRNGVDVESTDPAYHNNSKYWSEQSADSAQESARLAGLSEQSASNSHDSAVAASNSADRAEQAARTAGYLDMYIDEDGYLIYVRTYAVGVDFDVDEDGYLIMTEVA